MSTKQVIILVSAILVGFLSINQFFSYREAKAAISRDTNVSYVNQLNLIVTTNEKLKSELTSLDEQLQELRTTANVFSVLEKDIERFELLAGEKTVSGPGVSITIDAPLEAFWLIDLMNELFVSGAETLSLNGTRMDGKTGIVNQGEVEPTLYFNNKETITKPYTIEAVGDPALLYDYLTQNEGIIQRIKKAAGLTDAQTKIEKRDTITIPAAK